MLKFVRFLIAVMLLVWLGVIITNTFYWAPSLFNNESGRVPNNGMAGDIIGPLLHKMYLTGWLVLPISILLHGALWAMAERGARKAIAISAILLVIALGSQLYAGGVLEKRIHDIRIELGQEFGSYDAAPADNPQRREFSKLHGMSMMLVMVDLIVGLGSFFCVTQLVPLRREGPAEAESSAARSVPRPNNPQPA